MTVLTDLQDTWDEKQTLEAVISVRAALEGATMTLQESLQRVQEAKDSGNYDQIKPSLKAKLDVWVSQFETTLNVIENNPSIQEILNWRP